MRIEAPKSPLESAQPTAEMTIAAATLLCTPNPRDELVQAAGKAAETLGRRPYRPEHVVTALETLGWIEPAGAALACVHDVIADDVLDQVLLEDGYVREPQLEAGCHLVDLTFVHHPFGQRS